ncbi:MAG TPA: ABC transporter ATP-binding protein [Clostridiaceae bacterium]|nr:ABC transporter ATP-binding protein [Clostridiaceae bacterium]
MLRRYVAPLRGRVIKNAVIKTTGTLLEVVLPTILAFIVDEVTPTRDTGRIVFWGIFMAGCSIAAWFLNVAANHMASRTASEVVSNIRQDLFCRSLDLSARQLDEISVSSLESRLTSDTYVIHRFLSATLRMGIRSLLLFLGGVFFCFYLSWRLALVLVVLVIPLFFVIRFVFSRAIPKFRQVQIKVDDMVQVIRENIRGIKVSKALNKTQFEQERYSVVNEDVRQAEVAAIDLMALMSPLVNILLFGGLTVVLIYGAHLAGAGLVKTGTIIAFMSYFIQITNSLLGLNRMFNIYNRSVASTARITEVLDMPVDQSQAVPAAEASVLPSASPDVPEVIFRHVTFSYLGKQNDLEDISFALYPGRTLGIMGATGSGKSTIIRLLLRQYDVTSGEIQVRGVPLKEVPAAELKALFGIVFQNDFLFGDTVRANVRFGRDLDDDELMTALRHAQADDFLADKDGGLDFKLASKGVNLSGGQKQRLLLGRALAGGPDVLLLDDASSALDFKTEARLRGALRRHYETTTIIIAQRISSVRQADEILFLEKGRAIAQGDHDHLMAVCEPYREIAHMQLGRTSRTSADARQVP